MDLVALRQRVAKLVPFRARVQPSDPASFPPYVAAEFRKLDTTQRDIVQVLKDLDARLTDLETP